MKVDSALISTKVNFAVDVYQHGKHISHEERHNLVVNAGVAWLLNLMAGASGYTALTKFAVGTSGTAPAAGDTDLGAQVILGDMTETTFATGKVTFKYYLGSGVGNGNTLREAGLKDVAGHLFARSTFTDVEKDATKVIIFTWVITIGVV